MPVYARSAAEQESPEEELPVKHNGLGRTNRASKSDQTDYVVSAFDVPKHSPPDNRPWFRGTAKRESPRNSTADQYLVDDLKREDAVESRLPSMDSGVLLFEEVDGAEEKRRARREKKEKRRQEKREEKRKQKQENQEAAGRAMEDQLVNNLVQQMMAKADAPDVAVEVDDQSNIGKSDNDDDEDALFFV